MPYIVQDDLLADIPSEFLIQALDDDGDGVVDAWDDVYAKIEQDLHALVKSTGKSVPVASDDNLYDSVVSAARYTALSKCYTRRGFTGDRNPFGKSAASAISALKALLGLDDKTGAAPSPSFTDNCRKFTDRTEDGL